MKWNRWAVPVVAALLLTACSAAWRQGEVVMVQNEKVTIRIMAGQSTSDAGSEDMIDATLREAFPEVDFQWICMDWGDGFDQQMTSRFAAGQMPDILIGKAQDVPVYQKLGAILPLPQEACEGIAPDAMELVTIEGEPYGLPYNVLHQGVLYNREIFRELGLSVPTTRDELEKIVNRCEEAGYTPFGLHYGETWSIANLTMQFWVNDLLLQDPAWGQKAMAGACSFTTDELAADAFDQCRYMLEHSYEDATQINQLECNKRFAEGNTAMLMTGTWSVQVISQLNPEMDMGIFPYPNTTGDARLLQETNMTFMKGNTTANSELVDEILLKIGTDAELAEEIAELTLAAPTLLSLEPADHSVIGQMVADFDRDEETANVSLGNNQLVWAFQNDVAQQTLYWLKGERTRDELLQYADQILHIYK